MILVEVANTPYSNIDTRNLLPFEKEGLAFRKFKSLQKFVERCSSREQYFLVSNKVRLFPGRLEHLRRVACLYPHAVVYSNLDGIIFDKTLFVLSGQAVKDCEGDWDKLKYLGYQLINSADI